MQRVGPEFAAVSASPVGIDGPLERHALDAVKDGLHLDLNPLDLRGDPGSGGLEQPGTQRMLLVLRRQKIIKELGRGCHHCGQMVIRTNVRYQCRTAGY